MIESILRKLIIQGDFYVYNDGRPGVGLDYSWVDLTEEEAQWLWRFILEAE